MPVANIVREIDIKRTERVLQLEGIFDVPPSERATENWRVDIPVEKQDWNIGLIVGPSGCGKTTIGRQLFGDHMIDEFEWKRDEAVVDNFPDEMGIKEISAMLNSVGFSSPPSWLKPYHVLSNGEKFRCHIARAMAEAPDLFVIDEYSSVVDRTVARIGSAAIAKTIRRYNKKFIALSCHYDIEEWLQPDWIYKPIGNEFDWRLVRRFPDIDLEVRRVHSDAWRLFSKHHYLSADINKAAQCFVSFFEGVPASFYCFIHFVNNRLKNTKKGHRNVCLPDFQGVGIGNQLEEFIVRCIRRAGFDYIAQSSHPARIHHNAKSPNWKLINKSKATVNKRGKKKGYPSGGRGNFAQYLGRNLYTFRYVGPIASEAEARILTA